MPVSKEHPPPRAGRRGFSLLEMVIVVAITAAVLAMAVPAATAMNRRAALRRVARLVAGDILEARAMVASGTQGLPGWTADQRTEQGGVRFLSATAYEVFADNDRDVNGAASEAITLKRDLAQEGPYQVSPSGSEVRFLRNGTLSGGGTSFEVKVLDTRDNQTRTVKVSFAGKTEVEL